MDIKGTVNWIVSSLIWALGTTLTTITIVPGMNWKVVLSVASTTFGAAMVQHLREHPFSGATTPPVNYAKKQP